MACGTAGMACGTAGADFFHPAERSAARFPFTLLKALLPRGGDGAV